MRTSFEKYKKDVLSKSDKSSIGDTDPRIKGLCDNINSKKDYYTTSSCSGRISLVKDNTKKLPGLFLWRTHDKTTLEELNKELKKAIGSTKDELIYFKQEPCLVVVSCKNKESQKALFTIARNNGWKKSGIISTDNRYIIELMSTENISFPIIKDNKILVNQEFLDFIIEESNRKLELTWKKIDRLYELIKDL